MDNEVTLNMQDNTIKGNIVEWGRTRLRNNETIVYSFDMVFPSLDIETERVRDRKFIDDTIELEVPTTASFRLKLTGKKGKKLYESLCGGD